MVMVEQQGDNESDLMTPQDVARFAHGAIGAATVRLWARTGKLPAIRTASGRRLFRRTDVERVLADRRRTKKGGGR